MGIIFGCEVYMLNTSDKLVVYLDTDTLRYMYLSYLSERNYPVMKKLYTLLMEGYKNNLIVTPISLNHIGVYMTENKIEGDFLTLMGNLAQVQFHQRFTVRTLQLIRVINSFFGLDYKKQLWRDAFSSNPDDKYAAGFNMYSSVSAQNVIKALEREKKKSQIYYFIESFKNRQPFGELAKGYFTILWEMFPDLILPHLPKDDTFEAHMKRFLENDDIKDIPEYHIVSTIVYPILEAYGLKTIETGQKDDVLEAAEIMAAYMPYCHFYVTASEVVEQAKKFGINEIYNVKVYNNNESSLYRLIDELTEAMKLKKVEKSKKETKTTFRKSRFY